jgi:hypothetical protein
MAIRVTYQNPSISNGIKVTIHRGVFDEKTGKLIPNKFKKGEVKFAQPKGRKNPDQSPADIVDYWLDYQGGLGAFVEELPT